jgi:hypothetical protein
MGDSSDRSAGCTPAVRRLLTYGSGEVILLCKCTLKFHSKEPFLNVYV